MKIKEKREEAKFGEDDKNVQNNEEGDDNVIASLEDGEGEHFLYYDEDDEDDHKINENSDNNEDDTDNDETINENDIIQLTPNSNEENKQCKKKQNKSNGSSRIKPIKGKITPGRFRFSPSAESSNDDVRIVENNTIKSTKSRRRRKKRYVTV